METQLPGALSVGLVGQLLVFSDLYSPNLDALTGVR
jgi:hypothetical protein